MIGKRSIILITALFAVLTCSSLATPSRPDKANEVVVWMTLLHNNDGESDLIQVAEGLEDFGGADRFKTVVDSLKWEAIHGPRTPQIRGGKRLYLMVSSGDNFLAGPEFNASLAKGVPFYDTIAMDLIGYDAVAIGNHDFDFGPDVLADFIEGYYVYPPTYLSANLIYSGEPRLQQLFEQERIAKSTIVKKRGELIGIIGATTPNLSFISSPRNVEVMSDIAAAVQAEVAVLEDLGVNKIVLISHLQDIDGDLLLAQQLRGVDVMVAGGGDELLANPGDLLIPGDAAYGPYPLFATDSEGTVIPVVTTSGSYGYVGRLVVGFDKQGKVLEIGQNSGPVRVAGGNNPDAVQPDPTIESLVTFPVATYLSDQATNVIAQSEVDLNGLRSDVRSKETNEGNLIADALRWQAEQFAPAFGLPVPDVALQNGGGIRNDSIIAAGPITELDTFSMVPFPNFVTIVSVPRAQFKEILENAVSRTQPGDIPGGTGRFAQVSGFSFTYSASGDAIELDADGNISVPGTRVQEVILDGGTTIVSGGSVIPGPDIVIATIDFLAKGGDQYPYRGAPFTTLGATYQQALFNYIVSGLGGMVSSTDYPESGENRITELP
jgi:5'-nucleotidase